MNHLTGDVHSTVDAQSTRSVYSDMPVDAQLRLRGAFLTLLEILNLRIALAFNKGRESGDYSDEYQLCDVATVILKAYYRCGPDPVIP